MSIRQIAVTRAAVCFAFLVVLSVGLPVLAQSVQVAPLNPEFVKYVEGLGQAQPLVNGERNYGLSPIPVDLSHLRAQQQTLRKPPPPQSYAATYDLRALGRVTPVRDQNPYGTCWSFATFGAMESCLMPAESRNFSENNLVNLAGFDLGFNDGGHAFMSMAYLARWDGPINESDDSYYHPGVSPAGLTVRKHVQQVRLILAKAGPTLNDELKQVLMDNGAIYVSYYHSESYYRSAYRSYYYTGTSSHNHAVTLVGWDDNFDRTKFTTIAPGNGAYIVKNSWGTGWGESGYYYISYYDTTFAHGEMFAFLNAEPTANYNRQYSYDPLGWVGDLGVGSTTFWGANVFTAVASESLGAVGFYANSLNTSYTIEVRTGVSVGVPRGGTLVSTKTGTCSYPGYRTISLDTPAALTAGQRFSIVLGLTTPGYPYPQPLEYATGSYSSRATAAPGQSYYSGSGSSWTDLTTVDPSANFCIKGYTSVPVPTLSIARNGGMITLTWSAGVLQQADSILGPYTDVSGAVSPCTTACSGPRKFYRVRSGLP